MRKAAMTVIAAALAAVSTSATAQATAASNAASNAEKVAQYSTDQLKSELNLTADQVPKVQKVPKGLCSVGSNSSFDVLVRVDSDGA